MNLADRDVRLAKFAYHLSSQLPDVRWNRRVLGVKSGLICRNTFEGVVSFGVCKRVNTHFLSVDLMMYEYCTCKRMKD